MLDVLTYKHGIWNTKSRIFIMNMTSFKAPGGAENINII